MNIFKNVLKVTMGLVLIFLFSCKKESSDLNNMLTKEIEIVETKYQEGVTKIETKADSDDQKIETSASDSYKEQIRLDLEKSITKQKTRLKSGSNPVGILKSGYCGAYPFLQIFIDSEDRRWQSSKSGSTGESYVEQYYGNIYLKFCVVDAVFFERAKFDYALLDLGGNAPSNINRITRRMDNENDGNTNEVLLDGSKITGVNGGCTFDLNTVLGFYWYPALSTSSFQLPTFSLYTYGVFGKFGNKQGSIYSDDEDDSNTNGYITTYNISTSSSPYNIIEPVGFNTRIYISMLE